MQFLVDFPVAVKDLILKILIDVGVNESLWLQFGIFLVTATLIYFIVLSPYHQAYLKREESRGGEESAADINVEAQRLEQTYQARARELAEKQRRLYEQARSAATAEQEQILDKARKEAHAFVTESRERIRAELKTARSEVNEWTPIVTEAAVEKLLSRGN